MLSLSEYHKFIINLFLTSLVSRATHGGTGERRRVPPLRVKMQFHSQLTLRYFTQQWREKKTGGLLEHYSLLSDTSDSSHGGI